MLLWQLSVQDAQDMEESEGEGGGSQLLGGGICPPPPPLPRNEILYVKEFIWNGSRL